MFGFALHVPTLEQIHEIFIETFSGSVSTQVSIQCRDRKLKPSISAVVKNHRNSMYHLTVSL